MRVRLFAVVTALLLLVVALPFTATAAAPNVGRVSSSSYVDLAGSETLPLCGSPQQTPANFTIGVNYSGTGDLLGGTGSGTLNVTTFGTFMNFNGEIEIGGQPATIVGGASMMCFTSGYAILMFGGFNVFGGGISSFGIGTQALEPGDIVCGDLVGTMSDGVHPNQGRLSLTFSGQECLN